MSLLLVVVGLTMSTAYGYLACDVGWAWPVVLLGAAGGLMVGVGYFTARGE